MSLNYANFDPSKYRKQAASYSGMVSGVKGMLSDAESALTSVNSVLGGKSNSGRNELLTSNVIAAADEIKTEVSSVNSNLGNYTGLISGKAKELDEEEIAAYNRYLARLEANKKLKEKAQNNGGLDNVM